MAFKKSFKRKFKRSFKKGKKNIIKKTVKRMLVARGLNKPEVKLYATDVIAGNVPIVYNNSGISLIPFAQGTQTSQFIGDKISVKYLRLRGSVYNGNAVDSYQVRLIVVEDLQAMDTANLILNSAATSGYEILRTGDLDSFTWTRNPNRFKVLKDITWTIPPKGVSKNEVTFKFNIPLGGMGISYAPALTSGHYPVNKNLAYYIVADAAGMFFWMHTLCGFTDV